MTLQELESEWEKDSDIDYLKIRDLQQNIPKLIGKYTKINSREKILLVRLEKEFSDLYLIKKEYYLGFLPKETLEKYNWLPFGRKILKSDISDFINTDADLYKIKEKIEVQQIKLAVIKEYIYDIKQRYLGCNNEVKDRIFFEGGN